MRITQIGKVCHAPCAIYHQTGDCIMPCLGLFARVTHGGRVRRGDMFEVCELVPRELVQRVVLIISDRCSRREAENIAGHAASERLRTGLPSRLYAQEILPDEHDRIVERLKHYADGHSIDLILAIGGTVFAPREVTPEAVAAVVERRTPGLDKAMRRASFVKTPHAKLPRTVSGIRGRTLIVSLPGSEQAAVENLDAILPALGHELTKLRGDPTDSGPQGGGRRLS